MRVSRTFESRCSPRPSDESAEISLVFSYFQSLDAADSEMVSHAPVSWNRTQEWLSEMEGLRQSLAKPPGSAPEVRISPSWE
jgi:hypothetical protein